MSRKPHEVLHAAVIDGSRMRWFASPIWLETGEPDHPWHSFDDMSLILSLPESMRVDIQRGLKSDWGKETRTIATADGQITTIAPHFAAQGMFGALRFHSAILPAADRRRIQGHYLNGQVAALMKMTAHLNGVERLAFAIAGWR